MSTSDAGEMVVPLFRVRAAGSTRTKPSEPPVVRLVLLATPISAAEATGNARTMRLSEWPRDMANLLADPKRSNPLQMRVCYLGDQGEFVAGGEITIQPREPRIFADEQAWAAAAKTWRTTLTNMVDGSGADIWPRLATDITASLKGTKRKVLLGDAAGEKLEFHDDGAIKSDRPDASTVERIVGALSVRQADLASQEEAARAARVVQKALHGPAVVDDEQGSKPSPPTQAANLTADNYREAAEKRYDQALNDTASQRDVSVKLLRCFSEVLEGKRRTASDLGLSSRDMEVVPDQSLVFPSDKPSTSADAIQASHDYFTWPQRPAELAAKPTGLPGKPETGKPQLSNPPPDIADADGLGRARAMFLALQSDPALARLFCLAIDCEVAESDLLKCCGAQTGNLVLQLAVTPNPVKGVLPTVATAALLRPTGGVDGLSFWPISRFAVIHKQAIQSAAEAGLGQEADSASKFLEQLIEQEDGIVLADRELLGGGTRYELTSLDFRGFVESKRIGSPASGPASGDDRARERPRDRGQAMPTSGLTLLDKGRADQIVRDLALLQLSKKDIEKVVDKASDEERPWLVLYAEELTVGRRVDVAIAGPGQQARDAAKLEWRSLMSRLVNYEFGPDDRLLDKLLADLLAPSAGKGMLLEQPCFQPTARTIPFRRAVASNGGGSEQIVEAVAEEAIFLWRGSPVSLDVEGPQEFEADTPFGRRFDLPGRRRFPEHRPPPLRYGDPYVLRMEAAFTGGALGPEHERASASDPRGVIPSTGKDGIIRPRRFLRHEGIGPPVLLLPYHLSTVVHDVMGPEQLDQAIVRSVRLPNAPCGEDEVAVEPSIIGNYIEPRAREKPTRTMRIFIPPEVAPVALERHGALDGPRAPDEVLAGGLLDVAYLPRPRAQPQEEEQPGGDRVPRGFPIAIIEQVPSLDAGGAVSKRSYVAPDAKPVGRDFRSGVPVLTPARRRAGVAGETGTGYLPDPAIDAYCVRARRRGSDCYLDGFLSVPVYGKDGYPHVLPLVIDVQLVGPDRKRAPPTRVEDIAAVIEGDWFLDEQGRRRRNRSERSCRVRVVEVRLGPHEDYDLEVCCLPSEEMLATCFALPETIAVLALREKETQGDDRTQWVEASTLIGSIQLPKIGAYTGIGGRPAPRPGELRPVAAKLLDTMRCKWSIEEIAATRRLRVCHSMNLPSQPVTWAAPSGSGAPLPVRCLRPPRTVVGRSNAWDTYLEKGLKIIVQLPSDRTKAGTLTLKDASDQTLAGSFEALGKSDNAAAAAHGNAVRDPLRPYGDTPAGTYDVPWLVATGAGTAYGQESYGPHGALVLKPSGGAALTAAGNGRIGLLVHSGTIGAGNKLRPTHGCVRLRDGDMKSLIGAIQAASTTKGVRCEVVHVSVLVGTDPAPDDGADLGDDPPPNMLELIQGTFPGPVTPFPAEPPPLNPWAKPPASDVGDNELAVDLLLDGTLELDLGEIDGFDVIASMVAVDGQPIDNPARCRSPLSRRSGRWPKVIGPDGNLAYASILNTYGFDVDARGVVTLPRRDAMLLRVRNLPTPGPMGDVIGSPNGGGLFEPGRDPKSTAIRLYPLSVEALRGDIIQQKIAVPANAKSDERTRTIKVDRPHTVADGLARRVKLSIASLSRHATDFETTPVYRRGEPGRQAYYRRQPLRRGDHCLESESAEACLNATIRPTACDVSEIEPAFVFTRDSKRLPDGAIRHVLHRKALARVWLKRPWYSSGEAERLGVVLWPPDYASLDEKDLEQNVVTVEGKRLALADFQDADLGDAGAFITRWGGDPTRADLLPQRGFFIPPRAFAELDPIEAAARATNPHKPWEVTKAYLPIRRSGKTTSQDNKDRPAGEEGLQRFDFTDVFLLTYEPCFDPSSERWFVDIDLRTKYAAEPFVRFGLIRYQPNSISEYLKVSEPVRAMMPMLPERTVTIETQKNAESAALELNVEVHGPAGTLGETVTAKPGETPAPPELANAILDHPRIKLSLFVERGNEAAALTRSPLEGAVPSSRELKLLGRGTGDLAGSLVWHHTLSIPESTLSAVGSGKLVAYLEEVDVRMPASYEKEPISMERMLDPNTFRESGPRFSGRIPLMEL